MPNLGHLEDKIRRSSSFRTMTDLHDHLQYASHCRDELQVYFYMQENNIGTDHPQFWLSMLNALKLKCQFKLIIKKLVEIKKNLTLREYIPSNFRHHDYEKILEFEWKLTKQLEQDIRKRKGKKRRSVQQFELFSISKIQKKKRKVGGIEIYVDQDCRDNYKLEDYSDFFINNMKDEIQMRKFQYDRKQLNKPLSFLGMHESNIQKWSFQLINQNKRNSLVQQQKNNRESTILKISNDRQSNAIKRFSISRKSNANLMTENNPQSGFKTPKEIMVKTQTPVNQNQTPSNKKQVGTPQMMSRHLINDKSLLLACKKSVKRGKTFIHSPQESSQDITTQLNKQIVGDDYFGDDDHSFNYPAQKQVIRINNSQLEFVEDHLLMKPFGDEMKKRENIFDNKESVLDLGCVEWSMIDDDKKMDVENLIDKQLKQTIFLAQLETIQTFVDDNNKFHHIEQTPSSSMFCQEDISLQQNLSQIQEDSQHCVVKCLKSTQTLQSIDSNQQNLFSNQKQRRSSQNPFLLQAFKKDRKLFQVISIQDNKFLLNNNSNQSSSDFLIPKQNKDDMMSLEGNDQIQEMIDQMETGHEHTNLVLQTLRKKKISEKLMHQIREDEKEYGFGTHSQKKKVLNGLMLISQQKSYNSQRRYNSRERFSSGYFGDFH